MRNRRDNRDDMIDFDDRMSNISRKPSVLQDKDQSFVKNMQDMQMTKMNTNYSERILGNHYSGWLQKNEPIGGICELQNSSGYGTANRFVNKPVITPFSNIIGHSSQIGVSEKIESKINYGQDGFVGSGENGGDYQNRDYSGNYDNRAALNVQTENKSFLNDFNSRQESLIYNKNIAV